jgi:hypothetical protein
MQCAKGGDGGRPGVHQGRAHLCMAGAAGGRPRGKSGGQGAGAAPALWARAPAAALAFALPACCEGGTARKGVTGVGLCVMCRAWSQPPPPGALALVPGGPPTKGSLALSHFWFFPAAVSRTLPYVCACMRMSIL